MAFSQNRRLMGHSAKNQQIMNYRNTIYGFRDLLGRKFSDPNVQQEIKSLPFEIVGQKNDAIGIKVSHIQKKLMEIYVSSLVILFLWLMIMK